MEDRQQFELVLLILALLYAARRMLGFVREVMGSCAALADYPTLVVLHCPSPSPPFIRRVLGASTTSALPKAIGAQEITELEDTGRSYYLGSLSAKQLSASECVETLPPALGFVSLFPPTRTLLITSPTLASLVLEAFPPPPTAPLPAGLDAARFRAATRDVLAALRERPHSSCSSNDGAPPDLRQVHFAIVCKAVLDLAVAPLFPTASAAWLAEEQDLIRDVVALLWRACVMPSPLSPRRQKELEEKVGAFLRLSSGASGHSPPEERRRLPEKSTSSLRLANKLRRFEAMSSARGDGEEGDDELGAASSAGEQRAVASSSEEEGEDEEFLTMRPSSRLRSVQERSRSNSPWMTGSPAQLPGSRRSPTPEASGSTAKGKTVWQRLERDWKGAEVAQGKIARELSFGHPAWLAERPSARNLVKLVVDLHRQGIEVLASLVPPEVALHHQRPQPSSRTQQELDGLALQEVLLRLRFEEPASTGWTDLPIATEEPVPGTLATNAPATIADLVHPGSSSSEYGSASSDSDQRQSRSPASSRRTNSGSSKALFRFSPEQQRVRNAGSTPPPGLMRRSSRSATTIESFGERLKAPMALEEPWVDRAVRAVGVASRQKLREELALPVGTEVVVVARACLRLAGTLPEDTTCDPAMFCLLMQARSKQYGLFVEEALELLAHAAA